MITSRSIVRHLAVLCMALLGFSVMAAAQSITAATQSATFCDSFGKTWSISVSACPGPYPLALCLTGTRDTQNLLGCGPIPVYGTYILLLGDLSIYTPEVTIGSGCRSTFWQGYEPPNAPNPPSPSFFAGQTFNSGGFVSIFVLKEGACAPCVPGQPCFNSPDPASR
jgi:hypothetical protein